MDESVKGRRSLDFFMGLGFMGIAAFMISEGVGMLNEPSLVETAQWYYNPGLTIVVVGGILGLLGLVVGIVGLAGSKNPFAGAAAGIKATLKSKAFSKGLLVLACIAVYFFVFWGRIPYVISTFVFLAGMMFLFKAGKWWKILIISAVTVGIIWFVFGFLAMIPLP